MLSYILQQCNDRISKYPCCKENHLCDCVSDLKDDYNCTVRTADTYKCKKKMDTYVIRYGAAYASEIYHYLEASDFKSKIKLNKPIIIKSLGCGFSPDYYAIKKYLNDNDIQIPINYAGFDNSDCWDEALPNTDECNYYEVDLTNQFDISDADVVIIGKVFSTLYRNNEYRDFLKNLKLAVSTLKSGAIVIFIDINHCNFGRDVFHNSVSQYLPRFNQYYFNQEENPYIGNDWEAIEQSNIVFDIPDRLTVSPLRHTGKTVIFEYRK